MREPGQRPSRRRVLGFVVSALALVALAFWGWVEWVIARGWARMEKRVQELIAKAKAQDPRRPSIFGGDVPGNAWDDYLLAFEEFKKLPQPSRRILFETRENTPKADPVKAGEILSGLHPVFEHLRRGARRAEAQYPYVWESSGRLTAVNLSDHSTFAMAVNLEARRLVEQDRAGEAVDLLLSLDQMARDVGHNGEVYAEVVALYDWWFAMDELRIILQTRSLQPVVLQRMDRSLGVLDSTFYLHDRCMENHVLSAGNEIRAASFLQTFRLNYYWPDDSPRPTWRQLYSSRILEIDTFLRLDEITRSGLGIESLHYADERRWWEGVEARIKTSGNPLLKAMSARQISTLRRERITQLRLLQVMTHYLATGEVDEKDDPLGDKLRHALTPEGLRVWSAGRDGVDDGGTGGWNMRDGKDIVLEVQKP